MQKSFFIIALSLLWFSCEKSTDWTLQTEENNTIVVEGLLTNTLTRKWVKITQPVTDINHSASSVSDAEVFLKFGQTRIRLRETDSISGLYLTDTAFQGVVNQHYTLQLTVNDKQYEATTYLLPVNGTNEIEYSILKKDSLLYLDWKTSVYNTTHASMYVIRLNWSQVDGYQNLPVNETKAELKYYQLPSLDVQQIFKPEEETVYFPAGTRYVFEKFSLTPEHAEFIRTLLSETQWRGGFFDVAHSNVKSNLNNGAKGFYGGCSVNRTTGVINEPSDF